MRNVPDPLFPGSSRFGRIHRNDHVSIVAHCCAGSEVIADIRGHLMDSTQLVNFLVRSGLPVDVKRIHVVMCGAGAQNNSLPSFCQLLKDQLYRVGFRRDLEVVGNVHSMRMTDNGRPVALASNGETMPASHGRVTESAPDFGLVSTNRRRRRGRR